MATKVQMDLDGYPEVVIQDRLDAEQFVKILSRNGVKVNLSNVADKLDPTPYKCTECSDRFAAPKTFDAGQGHQTVFSARPGYSTDRTKYKHEHDGVFPEGSAEDRAWQKANRGF